MLIQGTHQFDRAAIMAAAHLSARRYRYGAQSYRSALREALRAAWSQARVARTCFVLNGNKGDPAEAMSLNRQAMMIRMKDRMTELASRHQQGNGPSYPAESSHSGMMM